MGVTCLHQGEPEHSQITIYKLQDTLTDGYLF